jgi:hypothetical protein
MIHQARKAKNSDRLSCANIDHSKTINELLPHFFSSNILLIKEKEGQIELLQSPWQIKLLLF